MKTYDVIIIGGGPGGYTAALKASRMGLAAALVERELVGGTCINWGCIPTKALLKYAKLNYKTQKAQADSGGPAAGIPYGTAHEKSLEIAAGRRERVLSMLAKEGVALYSGEAKLTGPEEVEIQPSGEKIAGRNIILATGSRPRKIGNVDYDGETVVTTRDALAIEKAPRSAVIVGSGATGMEFATVWRRFGARVTVLEMAPYIMGTGDAEMTAAAIAHFAQTGINVVPGVTVESVRKTPKGVRVTFTRDGKAGELTADTALVAAGILPNTEGIGLEALGVAMSRGYVTVDDRMRTSVPGIYAVGDITGRLALAFTASEQGAIAVRDIAGQAAKTVAYENIPRCIYSDIEVASVGLNAAQARERGYDVVTRQEAVAPYAKAAAPGEEQGLIKLVADAGTQTVYGAVMIGPDASDQIAAPARMIGLGATADAIIQAVCSRR